MSTKIPGVPELVWGVTQQEEVEQSIGCHRCLASGVYEPPSIVYQINGTSLCRAHTEEQIRTQTNGVERV